MGPILFLTGIFFLSFVSRVVFSPLMPTIENQMGITHAQAGSLALIQKEGRFRGEPPRPAALADLSSRTLFWVMIVLFCLALSGGVGIYAVLPLYLVKERGLDLANTLLSVSRVSGLVMVFLAGWLTDRVGEKRTIHLALLMAGAATALLALVSGGPLVVMVFVQPAIVSCFFPAGFKALSQIVPPGTRSLATGQVIPFGFLFGAGVIPAFIGQTAAYRSLSTGILITGILIACGSFIALLLRLEHFDEAGC